MFSFIGLVTRNPSMVTRHARRLYATHKAMRAYRKAHPACAWCGRKRRLEVHHEKPISVAPDLADVESNLITLCRPCHRIVGHNTSFRDRYVENVAEICATNRTMKTGAAK